MKPKLVIAIGAGCICATGATYASQTVAYTYDALGRLTESQIQSGTGSGTTQIFQYDNAGNRTRYQVSGVTGQTPVTLSMSSPLVNELSTGAAITVKLGAPSASGTLTLTENGQFLGSTWVSGGQGTVVIQGLAKGPQTVTAIYSGDGTYATETTTFTINVRDISWLPAVLNLLLQ
jgi:hypothetical protein